MKAIYFLVLSTIAGSLFAGTGQTYQILDANCCPQPVVQTSACPQYQTITITEPRVRWTPMIEYQDRQVQVQVPQVQVQTQTCVQCQPAVQTQTCVQCPQPSVQSVATQCVSQMQTVVPSVATTQCVQPQVMTVCQNGQCLPSSYPQNYVADSDVGTNIRYKPAILRTEDGYERQFRTPIRAAVTMLRVNRQTHDPDPPSLPIGPSPSFP